MAESTFSLPSFGTNGYHEKALLQTANASLLVANGSVQVANGSVQIAHGFVQIGRGSSECALNVHGAVSGVLA